MTRWPDAPAAGRAAVHSPPTDLPEHRKELFPLPYVDSVLDVASGPCLSRSSRRRFPVRQAAPGDANDIITALNALYG